MTEREQVIRGIYSRFDFKLAATGSLDDVWARHVHPDFMVYPPNVYPDMEPYRGFEGFHAFCRMLTDVWDEWSFEALDIEEAGDHDVVEIRLTAKGRGSGAEASERGWHLWTFHDGKAVSIRSYLDRGAAREAAGLADLQSPG